MCRFEWFGSLCGGFRHSGDVSSGSIFHFGIFRSKRHFRSYRFFFSIHLTLEHPPDFFRISKPSGLLLRTYCEYCGKFSWVCGVRVMGVTHDFFCISKCLGGASRYT